MLTTHADVSRLPPLRFVRILQGARAGRRRGGPAGGWAGGRAGGRPIRPGRAYWVPATLATKSATSWTSFPWTIPAGITPWPRQFWGEVEDGGLWRQPY